ncbi:PLAT/LH2 domain-containing protein [Acetivibrio straminisolvens]|nr:PLAT/LH2 domain-containing protein [Acetivibrio straminisolvens]
MLANYLCSSEEARNTWELFSSVARLFSDLSIPFIDVISEEIEDIIEDKILLPYVRPIAAYITGRDPKYIDDYDEAIESIKEHFANPAKLFLSLGMNNLQQKLEKEWGEFWKKNDCFDQPFPEFKRCLNMGKLCLIGTDNINKIIDKYYEKPKAGEPDCEKTEIKLHKHTLQWSLHEIMVVATTAKSGNASTTSKVFFGLKTSNNMEDKDFEIQLNSGLVGLTIPGSCARVHHILPSVVPISSIKSFTLRLAGSNQWKAENIYVIDVRTGIMLAKASNITLDGGKTIEIGVLEHLEDAYCQLQDGATRVTTITGLMVTIKTSSDFGSGTDGDVIFKMETTQGNVEHVLDKSFYNDFERGDLDTYPFQIRNPIDYNEIKNFYIRKRGGSDWKPEHITVCDRRTGICLAHHRFSGKVTSAWTLVPFDRTYMDNFINRDEGLGICRLQVVIKTSNDLWSGTDDNVYMEIKFDDGEHKVYLNTDWHNDFERGDVDTFNINLPRRVQKSSIKSFEFYKKGSDDWKIEWIKISDIETGEVLCYEQGINRKLNLSGERVVISSGYWNDPV